MAVILAYQEEILMAVIFEGITNVVSIAVFSFTVAAGGIMRWVQRSVILTNVISIVIDSSAF